MSISIVNLESGMPLVDEALRRLSHQLMMAKGRREKALKLIHGYGSSGKGGKIKSAVAKELRMMQAGGKIKFFIAGEDFSPFDETCRKGLAVLPELSKDKDFARGNPGITIVIL